MDVNGDGQTEGILRLEEKTNFSGEEKSWSEELTVILSLQDECYCYSMRY